MMSGQPRRLSPEEQKITQEILSTMANLKVDVTGAKGKADGIIMDTLTEAFKQAGNMALTYALQNLALQKKIKTLEAENKALKPEDPEPEPKELDPKITNELQQEPDHEAEAQVVEAGSAEPAKTQTPEV